MRWFPHWLPHVRLLLARRPWIYWLVVGCLAAGLALVVGRCVAALETQRASWGSTVVVLAASGPVAPGDLLRDMVTPVELPAAMVPPSAVREVSPSAVATQTLATGEVVVDADIARDDGPLALLPEGWMALAIEVADTSLFRLGDDVAVLGDGSVLAESGVVVQITDSAVVVGVPATAAAQVADAANRRVAVPAVHAVSASSSRR